MELEQKIPCIRRTSGYLWTDGLLLGNGNLGAVAFGDSGLEWIVNKSDIIQSVPEDPQELTHAEVLEKIKDMPLKNSVFLDDAESRAPRITTLSAAHLRVRHFTGYMWNCPAFPELPQELSLCNGELVSGMRAALLDIQTTSFIPRGTNTLCIRSVIRNAIRQLFWELVRPVNEELPDPQWHTFENGIAFLQQNGGTCYAVALYLPGGTPVRQGRTFSISYTADDVTAFLSVKSGLESDDPLKDAIAEAQSCAVRGFDALQQENRSWWHRYWQHSHADFTSEEAIRNAWYFSQYEVASTFGSAPVAGLNGLAYGPVDVITPGMGSPWYTHDQNIQIAMFPFMPLNQCGFIDALADTYLQLAAKLRAYTRRIFDCDGLYLPLCLIQDGKVLGVRSYRYTLCGGAYSGAVLAMAWRYGRNVEQLKHKIYPLLKEFITFYLNMMHRDEQGNWQLDWNVPPEIFTMTRNELCTISLLHLCLEVAVEAAQLLDTDHSECARWQEVLAHYPEPVRRSDGAWWCGMDIPESHYMYGGHLFYPFFPAEWKLDRDAAAGTLAYPAVERSFTDRAGQWHYLHEWSAFNASTVQMRLDGKKGWKMLVDFLDKFGKPNGLFSHNSIVDVDPEEAEKNVELAPVSKVTDWSGRQFESKPVGHDGSARRESKAMVPPVQEGSSAFLFLASEALLQSWEGVIRLFPGVPDDFTGSFHNLLAQGGFGVSAVMEQGKLVSWDIRANAGGRLRLQLPEGILEKEMRPGEAISG